MTALLLIDFQKAFEDSSWGQRNNPEAEMRAKEMLEAWRASGQPVIHTQHTSVKPSSLFYKGSHRHQFIDELAPLSTETVFQKQVNSAFIGTKLKEHLENEGITAIVVAGLITPHCVSTSVRMAGNYGYETYVVADASAAFDREGIDGTHFTAEQVHKVELAILHEEFATVINSKEAIKLITN
ncbi:cysteine hydrolase [Bacillus sp. T33-2]|nr:cysteine hydrolase [Bacillus sp. T33-2]